jgi:hypothetical protein
MIPLFPTQPLALASGLLFGPYEVIGHQPLSCSVYDGMLIDKWMLDTCAGLVM